MSFRNTVVNCQKTDQRQGCQNNSTRGKKSFQHQQTVIWIQHPKNVVSLYCWHWQRRAFLSLKSSSSLSPPAASLWSIDMKGSSLLPRLRSLTQMKRKQLGCYGAVWRGDMGHPALMILSPAGRGRVLQLRGAGRHGGPASFTWADNKI